jgi:PAS domain S-box-containing protein
MGNFYKESHSARFGAVCGMHDIVRPTEQTYTADAALHDRKIALLEQRAAALEVEVAHRKQLETGLSEALAARRRSEALLRDFIDNATIGLHWVLADGTIEWANDAELKMLGYSREEYVGRNISEFHADEYKITDILCRLARNEEIHDYEAPLRAKDGSVKWVAISSNVLFEEGRFIHTRCFTRDITARKRLEEEKAFLLELTRAVSRSPDYRTRLKDLARTIVPRLGDWCLIDIASEDGYDRVASAPGGTAVELAGSRSDERWRTPADRDPVMTVLRTGEPLIVPEADREFIGRLAGCDEHPAELQELAVRSLMIVPMLAHGRVVGAITLAASQAGRYPADDLPLAVDVAARAGAMIEIARLYHVAETSNRAKDEFLATLSHELRTPLTAILGWARMLSVGGLDPETLRLAIATIEQSARTQASLVDDLLDVSRVVSGKLSLQSEPVDVANVVGDVLQAMKLAADAKQIRVEASGLDDRLVVTGDSTRLQQIVWNLISNALKFSDQGARVDVRLQHEGGSARIVVRDQGRGIAPAFLPFVFDPFRQADSSATRTIGGLGLGLAIVKYLAEAHGGTGSRPKAREWEAARRSR